MEKGDIKDVMISLEDFRQLNIKNERSRISEKIHLLRLHPDLPKESKRVCNMINALVLNSELTVQDLFGMMKEDKNEY